jgi:hypothetical protein
MSYQDHVDASVACLIPLLDALEEEWEKEQAKKQQEQEEEV